MTAAFLQSELSSLIADAKRKNADVRTAAEKSLASIKAISVTSETQLSADLVRCSTFIDPFLLACKSQNVKLATTGTACLQRLVAATAIPRSRLAEIIQGFETAIPLGLDVQLKVLQTLPSLLQLYSTELHGSTLARTLCVSAELSASKLPIVNSTASATFQQLVSAVFSRIGVQLEKPPFDGTQTQASEDAFAIFRDLCSLLSGEKQQFVRLDKLPPAAILETIEGLISVYGAIILKDHGSKEACIQSLLPGLLHLLENSTNFGIVSRSFRISFLLLTRHITDLQHHLGDLLSLILTEPDRTKTVKWKRVLCLEFSRGLFSDILTLRTIYLVFDNHEERRNMVADCMASLVRTASEDPALIGLGRQTTIPTRRGSLGATTFMETGDVPVGANVGSDRTQTGVSQEESLMDPPCLDRFDQSNPPDIPDTYIYALVISCIHALADGLSKTVVPSQLVRKPTKDSGASLKDEKNGSTDDAKNKIRNLEPKQRSGIQQSSQLIETCWPAVLAICSTFLNAALDSYFYHMLIRTIQKFTQVAGSLSLETPRDAYLTLLAKVSVPMNVTSLLNACYGMQPALLDNKSTSDRTEDLPATSPLAQTPRQSLEATHQGLNIRNLLCLRALLNLGIALGPSLSQNAWLIIFQALQQVEALMPVGPTARVIQSIGDATNSDSNNQTSSTGLATEIAAVDTARRRMLDASVSFPTLAFKTVCEAVLSMTKELRDQSHNSDSAIVTNASTSLRPSIPAHKSTRSISGTWTKTTVLAVEISFALKTIGRLATANLFRFMQVESSQDTWPSIIQRLLQIQSNQSVVADLRLQASNIIDAVIVELCGQFPSSKTDAGMEDIEEMLLKYGIPALAAQTHILRDRGDKDRTSEEELAIVTNAIEALNNVVGAQGDRLSQGWHRILHIFQGVLTGSLRSVSDRARVKIFSCVLKPTRLIISDFLEKLDQPAIATMLWLLDAFSVQRDDINMSLTATSLYWNIAQTAFNRFSAPTDLDRVGIEIALPSETAKMKSNEDASNFEAYDVSEKVIWSHLFQGLVARACDDRAEVRTGALPMLYQTANAAIKAADDSAFVTVLCRRVIFPLLQEHQALCQKDLSLWRDMTIQSIQNMAKFVEQHISLLHKAPDFPDTWKDLVQALESLMAINETVLKASVFDSLANLCTLIRQPEQSLVSVQISEIMYPVWALWSSNNAYRIRSHQPNQDLITNHLRLWLELLACDQDTFLSFDDLSAKTSKALQNVILCACHDRYTLDIKQMTPDQKTVVAVLQALGELRVSNELTFATLLVSLTQDAMGRHLESPPHLVNIDETQGRRPTFIALALALLNMLQNMLETRSQSPNVWSYIPFALIIQFSSQLASTKYRQMPTDKQNPLWRRASTLGVSAVVLAHKHHLDKDNNISETAKSTLGLARALLSTSHLPNKLTECEYTIEEIQKDEEFDCEQMHRLHASIHVWDQAMISTETRKDYILLLFDHSLAARPWYNELSHDLTAIPLAGLMDIRRGSIRSPDLPIRRQQYRTATKCLFELVESAHHVTKSQSESLALLAAPYILLRLAQTLKTFVADQPLRGLEPPHQALQEDLKFVLQEFTNLTSLDTAFLAVHNRIETEKKSAERSEILDKSKPNDGKVHLKLMFDLLLHFELVWYRTPRLQTIAWQSEECGEAIESCIRLWKKMVSNPWRLKSDQVLE